MVVVFLVRWFYNSKVDLFVRAQKEIQEHFEAKRLFKIP